MTRQAVSFEEFEAALREDKAATKNARSEMAAEKSITHPTRLRLISRQTMSIFVEEPTTQIVTIFFIYLDIIAQCFLAGETPGPIWNVVFLFTTVFFTFELLLQAFLFRERFFSHWGCLVDTMLIATRVGRKYASFEMNQQQLAIFNFLRVWRFARLLNSYVAIEKQKQLALRKKLKLQTESTSDWKKKALLSEDIAKLCNEEVETLREALTIASKDVAAAMLGQYNPDLSHSIDENVNKRGDYNCMQDITEESSSSTDD